MKKIILMIIIWHIIIFSALCVLLYVAVSIRYYLDPIGADRDICHDDGLVWDGDENRCRDDCTYWNEADGCVPLMNS